MKKRFTLLALVLVLVMALAACGGGNGGEAPVAEGEVALRITGNVGTEMAWSEAQVRALETIEVDYTNRDGEPTTYTGVAVNTLLAQAGVSGASSVTFVAADDYTAKVALDELQACADCIVAFVDGGGFRSVLPGFASNVQVRDLVEIRVQ